MSEKNDNHARNDYHLQLKATKDLVVKMFEPLLKKSVLPIRLNSEREYCRVYILSPFSRNKFLQDDELHGSYVFSKDSSEIRIDHTSYESLMRSKLSVEKMIEYHNSRVCASCFGKGKEKQLTDFSPKEIVCSDCAGDGVK